MPTGFDAERLVFVRVTVTDREGTAVYESGDLDPNGDVRDLPLALRPQRRAAARPQLFSLQSKFITRMVRGGEREQVLALNYSPDPLPFLRPSTSSTILTGRPLAARASTSRTSSLWAAAGPSTGCPRRSPAQGPYRIHVEIKAGMVPVNLIHEIKDVGFDYGLSAREVAERVVAGHLVLWERETSTSSSEPHRPRTGGRTASPS